MREGQAVGRSPLHFSGTGTAISRYLRFPTFCSQIHAGLVYWGSDITQVIQNTGPRAKDDPMSRITVVLVYRTHHAHTPVHRIVLSRSNTRFALA